MKETSVFVSALDHCDEGIVIVDGEQRVVYSNEAAKTLCQKCGIVSDGNFAGLPELLRAAVKEREILWEGRNISLTEVDAGDYRLYYLRDVTDVKDLTTRLESDKQIFDLIGAGILISNKDGVIEVFNSFLEKMEGRGRDSVVGKTVSEAYHTTIENSEQLMVLKTEKTLWNVNLNYIINGKHINTLSTTYPIFLDDRLVRVASISRNVTTTRQLLENVIKNYSEETAERPLGNGARYHFRDILGSSSPMKAAVKKAVRSTHSRAPVMIYGETGTGKELFAQSIHNGVGDDEHQAPFVAINCASIPEQLLESILFGTVKGSYTDAKNNIGLFEQAEEGTLFLDEIHSMPIRLQTKILRVLQERVVRRLGDSVERPINCRIISSCNRNPIDCVKDGTIREDLYYRLVVITIEIPPLRERGNDLIELATHFLRHYGRIYGLSGLSMADEYRQALYHHSWPGNVRELEHTIESSVAMLDDEKILEIKHLPLAMRSGHVGNQIRQNYYVDPMKEDLNDILADVEKQALLKALRECDGNISRAGERLGISRQNMQYRLKKFGITPNKTET